MIRLGQVCHLVSCVHYRGMISSSEEFSDRGERYSEHIVDEIDSHLSCIGYELVLSLSDYVGFLYPVISAGRVGYRVHRYDVRGHVYAVFQRVFHGFEIVGASARQRAVKHDFGQSSFELSYIGSYVLRNKENGFLRYVVFLCVSLFLQYSDPGFDARFRYVHRKTALEPRFQPVLQESEFSGVTVGSEHYLFSELIEIVESMEQRFLCACLSRKELHVVHHQNVHAAVFESELFVQLVVLVVFERIDVVVDELFGSYVKDFCFFCSATGYSWLWRALYGSFPIRRRRR